MKNEELIDKLRDCAKHCYSCSNACLGEDDVKMMVSCIRSDRECAALCETTARLLALESRFAGEMVALCEKACSACADECDKHEEQHCKDCAKACRECAEACRSYA